MTAAHVLLTGLWGGTIALALWAVVSTIKDLSK